MANEIDSKIIIRENNLGDGLEFDINNKVNLKLGENSPIKITDGAIDNNVSLDYDPDGKTISLISGEQILPLPIDNLASTTEVEEAITSAVENLDVSDDATEHEFVTSVNETDGKISVTRSPLAADDMPDGIQPTKVSSPLGHDNISNDISTLDSNLRNTITHVNDLDSSVNQLSGYVNTLNGDDSTAGSVSNSIKTVIEALDVTATTFSGASVPSSISETDGKINVTSRTLTKGDLELGNVDNTSDANKPISTATQGALDNKVDKISGKGLSTNDYTNEDQTKLNSIDSGAQVNVIESVKVNNTALTIDSSDKSVNIDLSDYAVKTALRTVINTQLGLASDNTNIDLNTSDNIKNVLGAICKSLGFNLVEPTE